jgi:hypothetical protein
MPELSSCPVRLDAYFTTVKGMIAGWNYHVDCPICGKFELDRDAYDDFLDVETGRGKRLNTIDRARIAHKIRTAITAGSSKPKVESEFLRRYIEQGCPSPSPREQAVNAIRYIGDLISRTGEHIENLEPGFFIIIGSPSPAFAGEMLFELVDAGKLTGLKHEAMSEPPELASVNLTLSGWDSYEQEKKGRVSGSYGFIAMKFGATELEALVSSSIKPTIKAQLSFDVVDMRDVARAGVIDNIMRAQIRDAAFIIVDLTHDNSGAYWEAGYAEGLGKPVIYICEKSKFEKAQTHFDTNHCTTVQWDNNDNLYLSNNSSRP